MQSSNIIILQHVTWSYASGQRSESIKSFFCRKTLRYGSQKVGFSKYLYVKSSELGDSKLPSSVSHFLVNCSEVTKSSCDDVKKLFDFELPIKAI